MQEELANINQSIKLISPKETLLEMKREAAMLAGVADGKFSAIEDTALSWNLDRRFHSTMAPSARRNLTSGWYQSVMKTRLSVS